jgi:protein-disulfide isomerase
MLQSAAKNLLASAFLIALATTSFAETLDEKLQLNFYGSFIHTKKIPNTLFYFDEIERDDSFELRKAMRNHDIDTIVLSSGGGSVLEGLQMAGIIRDKKLTAYVPERGLVGEGNCASACAFMFFGGVSREAGGKLGVHQFYSQNSNESAKIGNIQGGTQYTAGEIIGFLNDFDTPPFVFEKMFQQSDMYYFNDTEIAKIETKSRTLSDYAKSQINNFIDEFSSAIERLDTTEIQSSETVKQNPSTDFVEIDTSTIPDMMIGNPNAKVTVIEYASYTCPHCASFHADTFKDLKKNYIDTDKINFVFREVYFDRYGLWASMIARCAGPEKFFGLTDLMFQSQSSWTRAGEPAAIIDELRKLGRQAGIYGERLEVCLNDSDKAKTLVAWYQEKAGADNVDSTPSFIINGKKHTNMSFAEMSEIIDAELRQ